MITNGEQIRIWKEKVMNTHVCRERPKIIKILSKNRR